MFFSIFDLTNLTIILDLGIKILSSVLFTFTIFKTSTHYIKILGKRWDLDLTIIQMVNELIKYFSYLFCLSLLFKIFGMDLTAVFLSFGIVGVAISFASKDMISNFLSGTTILFDKSFKVGDIIEINDKKGEVVKLGFRTTNISTENNHIITIPNLLFANNPYINYTSMEKKRLDLNILIPYEKDLDQFMTNLLNILKNYPWSLNDPIPKIKIIKLSNNGIEATVSVWIKKPWNIIDYRSIMAYEIQNLLKES